MEAPPPKRQPRADRPSPDGAEPAGSAPPPVLDPRLDELPLPLLLRRWAAAKGITTLRQLARIPPQELLVTRAQDSTTLARTRAVLERFLGRRWEELASVEAPGDEPPVSRRPAGWDELRLVLPEPLLSLSLSEIYLDLPPRIVTFAEREGMKTLGELTQRSEAQLLAAGKIGSLSVRRAFRSVLELAKRRGVPVAMPPPASIRTGPRPAHADPGPPGLIDAWRSAMEELPPNLRTVMSLRAGLDGRPLARRDVAVWQGVPPARVRTEELRASALLARGAAWVEDARTRFEAALREGPVPLNELAQAPWWAGAVALPDALDYFGEMVLEGQARVLDVDGEQRLVPGTRRRPAAAP
jgi:hypothetical protein